jgi:hypothetical protein
VFPSAASAESAPFPRHGRAAARWEERRRPLPGPAYGSLGSVWRRLTLPIPEKPLDAEEVAFTLLRTTNAPSRDVTQYRANPSQTG